MIASAKELWNFLGLAFLKRTKTVSVFSVFWVCECQTSWNLLLLNSPSFVMFGVAVSGIRSTYFTKYADVFFCQFNL